MDEMVALRCKYCGAPLEKKDLEGDSPFVTCPSCGTTQQRMDAKAYLDQMMGQVQSWISKAIPGGFSLSQAENVDSIARYNIFNTNVRPRVELEYSEYKFAVNTLLANSLLVLPFMTTHVQRSGNSSADAFGFNARVKSVEALAVDDASKSVINAAAGMSTAYAMLCNNIKLLEEDKDGRFILMANNFKEISESFKKIDEYGPAAERFSALSDVCTGCEKLLNGLVSESGEYFDKAAITLEKVRNEILGDINLGIMYSSVNQELSQAKILKDITGFMSRSGGSPLKTLDVIRRIFVTPLPTVGKWDYLLTNKTRFDEILNELSKVLAARNGGTLKIVAGAGNTLVPFWDVDLKYSFQTGSAWKKKSVEVMEDILIPADFVIDSNCLSNPSTGLTPVFSNKERAKFLDSIQGKESSISGGSDITIISRSAAENSPGARRIAIPLSTRKEAEKLTNDYVNACSAQNDKLKLSKPYVKDLIYIPCDVTAGGIKLPEGFGNLVPERCRRVNDSNMIII